MWSWGTFIFYLIMSVIGCYLLKLFVVRRKKALYGILYFTTWIIWAVGRYVGWIGNDVIIGGADAVTYREFFEICLIPNNNHLYSNHTEIIFQLLTKGIRVLTSDYHVYFAVIYSIILLGFMLFIKEFCVEKMIFIPLIMVGIIYIKSFSLIRGILASSIILIGVVCLKKRKNILCILLMLISVFIQRASIVYASFPVFYWIYSRKKLNKGRALRLILLSILIGFVSRMILSNGSWAFFKGGAYDKYIVASTVSGYWIDYFKIIIDQVFMLLIFIHYSKSIEKWILKQGQLAESRYIYLKQMCYYDLLLIPFCGVLNIWRACDYFFLPRLIMLGIFCASFKEKIISSSKKLYNLGILLIVIIWFGLRMWTMHDTNSTMPYYFDLKGLLGY